MCRKIVEGCQFVNFSTIPIPARIQPNQEGSDYDKTLLRIAPVLPVDHPATLRSVRPGHRGRRPSDEPAFPGEQGHRPGQDPARVTARLSM